MTDPFTAGLERGARGKFLPVRRGKHFGYGGRAHPGPRQGCRECRAAMGDAGCDRVEALDRARRA